MRMSSVSVWRAILWVSGRHGGLGVFVRVFHIVVGGLLGGLRPVLCPLWAILGLCGSSRSFCLPWRLRRLFSAVGGAQASLGCLRICSCVRASDDVDLCLARAARLCPSGSANVVCSCGALRGPACVAGLRGHGSPLCFPFFILHSLPLRLPSPLQSFIRSPRGIELGP